MNEYLCSDGDRLDTVVYQAYASLQPMDLVLIANPHLLEHTSLRAGEMVALPFWQPPIAKQEARTLW